MKENIDEIKLYEYFKSIDNFSTFLKSMIKRFDFDNDGKILKKI